MALITTKAETASTINANNITSGTVSPSRMTPGSVIQVQRVSVGNGTTSAGSLSNQGFSTTSTSYVSTNVPTLTITTKVANSHILVTSNVPMQTTTAGNGIGAHIIVHSLDSYGLAIGETLSVNYNESTNGWSQNSTLEAYHSPNVAAGTAITYDIWCKKHAGSHGVYCFDTWGKNQHYNFMAMEIAP